MKTKGIMTVTKMFKFCAGHSLPGHPKCGNFHGHNYILEVELSGTVEADGFVVDFGEMKSHIQPIVDVLDHRNLNEISGLQFPTAENILYWIGERLEKRYSDKIMRMRLWETDTSYAEWRRN